MWATLKDHKGFLLFVGRLFSSFGDGLMFIAVVWLTYTQTNSVLMVGGILALTSVPSIICMPLIGVLLDRFDRLIIAIIIDFFQFFLLLTWVYLLQANGFNVVVLYVFAILLSICQSITIPTHFSLVSELFKDRVLQINSLLSIAEQAGYLVGSSAGGFILVYIHTIGALFIDSLTFVVSGFALLLLRSGVTRLVQETLGEDKPGGMFASIAEIFSYTRKHRDILVLILMSISTYLVIAVLNVLLAPFAKTGLHAGSWEFGLLDAIFGVGSILGSLVVGWFKMNLKKRILGIGFLTTTGLLFVFGANTLFVIAVLVNFLLGSSIRITITFIDTYTQIRVNNAVIGRISSTTRFIGGIFGSIAMYTTALIAQNVSFFFAFSSLAIYVGLIGLLALLSDIHYGFDQTDTTPTSETVDVV